MTADASSLPPLDVLEDHRRLKKAAMRQSHSFTKDYSTDDELAVSSRRDRFARSRSGRYLYRRSPGSAKRQGHGLTHSKSEGLVRFDDKEGQDPSLSSSEDEDAIQRVLGGSDGAVALRRAAGGASSTSAWGANESGRKNGVAQAVNDHLNTYDSEDDLENPKFMLRRRR